VITNILTRIVSFCHKYAWIVAISILLTSLYLGYFVSQTIKINTDIDQLMGDNLQWRDLEQDLVKAFPQNEDRLVIVIDGDNADSAENAASILYNKIKDKKDLFKSVKRPDAILFFQKNGFLFLSKEKLGDELDNLISAQSMIGGLAKDPSLRGIFHNLSLALQGIENKQITYDKIKSSVSIMAQTIQKNINGEKSLLPWQSMMKENKKPSINEIRKYIITQPVLDFSSLSPGKKASSYIRKTSKELNLTPQNGVKIRLTGSVALNDEEFASVANGTGVATIISMLLVMLLLFLALKSVRLIIPILITLIVGLITTTAFAMASIGSLNLISVAFAVMFVGMAVDFGIQFSVRFREEHYKNANTKEAMRSTAYVISSPLCFAACATILGFMAFIPTDYRGVSELGIIASAGMAIAFLLNITLLPALLSLFKPPAEKEAIAYSWTKPIDNFLNAHRKKLLLITTIIVVLSSVIASQIRFDFDPLNLKDPKTESVSTLFDIMKDPNASPYTIEILASSLGDAIITANKLDKLTEVNHTITLNSFIPKDQEEKLSMIEDANFILDPSLNPINIDAKPSDKEIYASMKSISEKLDTLGDDKIEAKKLSSLLKIIIQKNDPKLLKQLDTSLLSGINNLLAKLRKLLTAEKVTIDNITPDLRNDWITKDGRAKIEVYPKGNARDYKILTKFTKAVRSIEPNASGAPISIQESGKTVINAFIEAGILALIAISILGFIVLKSLINVFRLIFPLIIAGILTMATMVIINLPLNFANIIALPLLLSLGVTYAIYFITYWKNGNDELLHSSMARAVLFSAGTTLVAFGSLSLSSHTGTSGMGELLTIALLYSIISSFLILPLLLDRLHLGKNK